MGQIIKSFLGVFLLLLMTITAGGITTGYLQVLLAQDCHARVISELEDSHFSVPVIQTCLQEAKEQGYEMSFLFYYEDGSSKEVKQIEQIPVDTVHVRQAKVQLDFEISIAFFEFKQEHRFLGYAR